VARLFGSLKELVKLVFRKDSQEVGIQPNQSTTYTDDRDFDLPPGDTSQTLMSEDATQTVTNKTIDATSNTLQNIADANIATAAGISRDKLGAGTADHVVINDGSGNLSSESELDIQRGGTGASNALTARTK
jgi:hypothetical protein